MPTEPKAAPVCDIDLYADEVQGNLYPYVAHLQLSAKF
jgi:hypothetical protein